MKTTSNKARLRAQLFFFLSFSQQIGTAAGQQPAREVNCILAMLCLNIMERLLSLKLQCLFSIGNNGFHIENFPHVFQMSENKNKKLQKKNYIHSFQEGKLFS